MKKSGIMFIGLAMVLGVFLLAGPASAQVGFYVGTGIGYASPQWSGDLNDGDPQGGLGLELIHLGYNFTDNLGVGLQWGSIAGELTGEVGTPFGDIDIDEGTYGEGYITISGRYTFTDSSLPLTPYVELGIGQYVGLAEVENDNWGDADVTLDPAIGYRIAVGGIFPFGNFYLAPELSYHMVEFDDIEYETDGGDWDDDNIGSGDFLLLLIKVGYSAQQ